MFKFSNLYSKVTEDFRIDILPLFLQEKSSEIDNTFYWMYTVDIKNLGVEPIEILSFEWKAIDFNGLIHNIKHNKLNEDTSILVPGDNYFYNHTTYLNTPSGIMVGSYLIRNLYDGKLLKIPMPTFSLDSPFENHLPS